ncbi:hypothetical protein [Nocardia sp. NPDC004711]
MNELLAACQQMTDLARLIDEFVAIMTVRRGGDLDSWIKPVRDQHLESSILSCTASNRITMLC